MGLPNGHQRQKFGIPYPDTESHHFTADQLPSSSYIAGAPGDPYPLQYSLDGNRGSSNYQDDK